VHSSLKGLSEHSWLHLKRFLQWTNSAEHLGTRKSSAGMTSPGQEYLCVSTVPATIPTTQSQFLMCPEKQTASQRRCCGAARLSGAQKGAGCTQTVSTVLAQSATAKAVLVTAQTKAKLTLVIITWYSPQWKHIPLISREDLSP